MMSKRFQKYAINKSLKLRGIDTDLIDTDAKIDSTLSLEENFTVIVGKRKQKQETSSIKKIQNYMDAQDYFSSLNSKRQRMDSNINAKKTFEQSELTNKNFKKWKKHPNRFDIFGVDTKYY